MRIAMSGKVLALVLAWLLIPAMGAMAQDDANEVIASQWNDFIDFIRVARPDAALANGQAILQANPDPRLIYRLSTETAALDSILARGQRLEGLAETVADIRDLIEEGYRLQKQDPQQIRQAIALLEGQARQYAIGSERLIESGEYALPLLVETLRSPQTSLLMTERIRSVLPRMGLSAVRPLCEALEAPEAKVKEIVCQALGEIGYSQAAPYLLTVVRDPAEVDTVRSAARAALIQVTGDVNAADKPLANYFHGLAEKYYSGDDSVEPDETYPTANVWFWREGLGLDYVETPTPIFLDVYAMRTARRALMADSDFYPAVSLWLAANLRKEANLPAGQADPTRVKDEMDADAYSMASGAGYMQEVLARALNDDSAAVAGGAIMALRRTAGASNLVRPTAGGATPLVAALSFPDRRVRIMAGLTLANARPTVGFDGSEMVMPTLVEALRQTGRPTVLLATPDMDERNRFKDFLRQGGYDVVDVGSFGEAVSVAEKTTGVEVVLLSANLRDPGVSESLAMLRANPTLTLLPVVLLADPASMIEARRLERDDDLVLLIEQEGITPEGLVTAVRQAEGMAAGVEPMTSEEATRWVIEAADAIRMLGLMRTTVFKLTRAEKALVDNLADPRDNVKVASANALAAIRSGSAQQAIVELGNSDQPEPIRIAAYLAAAESVRAIGNQLTETQAQGVVDVVRSQASDAIRDAASELLGSLNLPSDQIKSLIVDIERF